MTNGDDFVYPFNDGDSLNAGITLRQHFAGLALQGLCADPETGAPKDAALAAVKYADALIAALNGELVTQPVTKPDISAADEAIKLGRTLGYIIGDDWTEWEVFIATLFKGKRSMAEMTFEEQSQWLSTLRAMERACKHQESLKEGVTA